MMHLACVGLYTDAGVDLADQPVVGLGSVCRRQASGEAVAIISELRAAGVPHLHGFGFKVLGLRRAGHLLISADSMAWSIEARRTAPLPGCQHKNCAHRHTGRPAAALPRRRPSFRVTNR